jgi:hypothetical protein
MKNHNISYFKGNVETSIKNGDFKNILIFPGLASNFVKLFENFPNAKEIEPTEEFPYKQTLLKFRSHFRIGEQQIRLVHIDDIINRNEIDKEKLVSFIQNFCRLRKNTINVFPLLGSLVHHSTEIEKILNDNVRDTKFVIIS